MPYQRIVTITIIIILFLIIIIIIFSVFIIIIIVIFVQGVRSADKSLDTAYILQYRWWWLASCDRLLLTSCGTEFKWTPNRAQERGLDQYSLHLCLVTGCYEDCNEHWFPIKFC